MFHQAFEEALCQFAVKRPTFSPLFASAPAMQKPSETRLLSNSALVTHRATKFRIYLF